LKIKIEHLQQDNEFLYDKLQKSEAAYEIAERTNNELNNSITLSNQN